MKLIIAFIALTLSTLTFACTDFSGTYQNSDGSIFILNQAGCESIRVAQSDLNYEIATDGVIRQIATQDITYEGQVVGKVTISALAKLSATELFLTVDFRIASDGQTQFAETKMVNTLNANGDLVSVATFQDGKVETTISKRIK